MVFFEVETAWTITSSKAKAWERVKRRRMKITFMKKVYHDEKKRGQNFCPLG